MTEKKRRQAELLSRGLFVVYMLVLIYFLFFAEGMGRTEASAAYRYNLTLFKEISRFWRKRAVVGYAASFINIAGNVLCFVPFGLFLPGVSRRFFRNGFIVILSGLCLSLVVETIQLLTRIGSFDVDDLFLNTIGVVTGYLAGRILVRLGRHYNEKKTI